MSDDCRSLLSPSLKENDPCIFSFPSLVSELLVHFDGCTDVSEQVYKQKLWWRVILVASFASHYVLFYIASDTQRYPSRWRSLRNIGNCVNLIYTPTPKPKDIYHFINHCLHTWLPGRGTTIRSPREKAWVSSVGETDNVLPACWDEVHEKMSCQSISSKFSTQAVCIGRPKTAGLELSNYFCQVFQILIFLFCSFEMFQAGLLWDKVFTNLEFDFVKARSVIATLSFASRGSMLSSTVAYTDEQQERHSAILYCDQLPKIRS